MNDAMDWKSISCNKSLPEKFFGNGALKSYNKSILNSSRIAAMLGKRCKNT